MRKKTGALLALMLTLAAVLALTMNVSLAEEDVDLMFIEQPDPVELPVVEAEQEDDTPLIELLLDGYELTFKDLLPQEIVYAADEETLAPDMVFSVILSGEEEQEGETDGDAQEDPGVPVFTMRMEEDVGDHVVVLSDEAGHIVPVAFFMAQMPEGLDPVHTNEFIAAQMDVHVLTATLAVKSVPEKAQGVSGETSGVLAGAGDYELTYSAPEAVALNVREEDGAFVFFVSLGEADVTVFTVAVGSEDGDIVQMLTDPAGSRIPAAIRMASCPETLDNGQRSAFYAAQEAVMQVISTMTLR